MKHSESALAASASQRADRVPWHDPASHRLRLRLKCLASVALLWVSGVVTASAGDFNFGHPVNISLGTATSTAIAVGDVNGDGFEDIAVATYLPDSTHRVEIFLQRNDGTLQASVKQQIPGEFILPNPLKMEDLDGDGSNEILVGYPEGLAVLKWNSGGALNSIAHSVGHDCGYLATADVDVDGDTDVVCEGYFDRSVSTFYGNGAGGVDGTRTMQSTSSGAKQMQLADVTGDGRPDLLIAGSQNNYFSVYENDEMAGFLPALTYTYPPDAALWSFALEVMDVNADGVDEIIAASPCNTPCSKLLVYQRTSDDYFHFSSSINTYDNPGVLIAHDFNLDGRKDLLVGHNGWDQVGIYQGGSTGLSTIERRWGVRFSGDSNTLTIGDINHDGCTDVAVASSFGLSLLYGRCVPYKARNDFNGDGISDLLWRNGTNGQNAIWKSAQYSTQQAMAALGGTGWAIRATGDFDGDGKTDVVWHDAITGNGMIWKSANSQIQQSLTRITNLAWTIVGTGDFDGDGKSDLLWRNLSTGANGIWKSGNFATQQTIVGVSDLRWRVVGVGDFNGDGKSDILWRHSVSGSNAIWLSGNFQTQQSITGVTNNAWQVGSVGDFDGDSKSDIFWRSTNGANAIWRSGNYLAQQPVSSQAVVWTMATVGDYDQDYRDDVVWRNTVTGQNVIWHAGDTSLAQDALSVTNKDWRIVR